MPQKSTDVNTDVATLQSVIPRTAASASPAINQCWTSQSWFSHGRLFR